jgi:hypothetical protein
MKLTEDWMAVIAAAAIIVLIVVGVFPKLPWPLF